MTGNVENGSVLPAPRLFTIANGVGVALTSSTYKGVVAVGDVEELLELLDSDSGGEPPFGFFPFFRPTLSSPFSDCA